ncbi:hypothetical protein D4764_0216900 [Takifugu flavidus]|uniref:Uncharacterized protein n=1 Tax=Takifugu flavidus TaxID=433684 RepID=A0A5C6MN86_9TELE|nr:hypothetical protein D4764_0216900 [Takifugu flavidus]
MSFLPRVAGLSLRDRVRSSDIREELGVEPLLLHIERKVFRTCPTGRRPRGRPRTKWRDYISHLAWERLGFPGGADGSGRGEGCLGTLLKLLPPQRGSG